MLGALEQVLAGLGGPFVRTIHGFEDRTGERGLTVRGRRVGHLLNPRTGRPAPDFGSATAIAPSGLVADILSTAFFVLGPERASL